MDLLTAAICIIVVFALLETPLFAVIAAFSISALLAAEPTLLSVQLVLIEMNRLASMPVLVALPMFVLVGSLLTETGAPGRLMNFMSALVGWLPGGIGIAALCSCAFFTALTGASGVTIVALGGILYPVLRKRGYPDRFSLGLLTTAGSRGLLFPPSLPVILYGVVSQTDIGAIFKAALAPGILTILIVSVYAFWFRLRQSGGLSRPAPDPKHINAAFIEGIWEWPVLLIVVAGVYGGYVTIAEVAALVLVYAVVVYCFVTREVHFFRQLPDIVVESAVLSGAIVVILGVALGLTGVLVDARVPDRILSFLTSVTESRLLFLAGLNLFLLVVGCIMDIFSAIVIVVPIMVPIALTYGIDPIHLCVIFMVNLEIGYSTPPVGINLFIASMKFQKPLPLLYGASLPYLVLLLAALLLITYVPWFSLFLVR